MAAKKAGRKKARRTASHAPAQATVRFYCHGIGDCHLLRFDKDNGDPFWVLIDCGIHTSISGGRAKIDAIVADIASVTNHLDVVVGTHEHWDHLSGFHTAREAFSNLSVGEVWLGWTENPDDEQARALDKFKGKALAALQGTQVRLAGAKAPHLAAVRNGVDSLMGFHFGLEGEKVRAARNALEAMASKKVRYLEPSKPPLTFPGLPNLRVYVLGPPRDEDLIKVRERKSEMYGLGAATARADALISAIQSEDADEADDDAPFEPNMGADLATLLGGTASPNDDAEKRTRDLLHAHYLDAPERRIDADWLGASAELAIQLDDRTNNSSLVLAFEFIDTGRVLLFTADAQVGNWLSWQDVAWNRGDAKVTGPDLLARTVLLKVGHHGSANATLEEKGLELMNDPDLTAFIPTNKKDAKKVHWGAMPFDEIVDALHAHAGKRLIRADDPWPQHAAGARVPFKAPSGSVRAVRRSDEPGLWVEMEVA
ncbi:MULTISPECIES: hypothetical protein [unclassified Lysobacter]|uniref:hypothetical protein n=1 Tax=unclassified Lysobacter TaxID=2635362 RepID=UPI001BEB67CD|nr:MULTISPECIES: hypothetical protein [unclassified Lysobacter]MBT2748749.1 hypothetical protein [Lysobacter sp. ISL-42]MBT2751684.1 hypothetical protein [Lysobacter sp. ISL-50]MBT2775878.1 hypothetical protein [Lysobacter sp. ISL-54]MBT2782158.1 hypothetical protein [Lysobacter sp. ISL-52]